MANPHTAELVAKAWEEVQETTPDPFLNATWLWEHLGGPRLTYREELDRPLVNYRGEVIPRIVIVRRNLQRLGKPNRPPRLPD